MTSALPTGTVTFLFTDIEGSTRLLQRLGETYVVVLREHQRLLRQAFAEHGGVEVDTQGDSFFVAFPTAPAAVAAAAAATRALAAYTWPQDSTVRVRMGLHTGAPQNLGERYVGIDVHRAARIAAAGHGGQILLSDTTRTLAAQALPKGATLRDLGAHRLKDLQHPEQITQVVLADLPSDFPPLKTLDRRSDHLPIPPTPFVGRDRELAELQQLLETPNARLLTLVGPGGIGKSRLAVEVAQRNRASFTDGAHFVSLAVVSSADLLLFAIGEVLEVSFTGEAAPAEQLVSFLRDKRTLLLLDNFEHLVEGGPLLANLLAEAPQLKLLITSRERLHLQGEWVLPLEGIDVPLTDNEEHFESYSAIQLFVQSAQRARPDFALQGQVPEVLRICQLVEGMPLALELAAAWVRLLPCSQIVKQLTSSLDLLASPLRDVPERHRSLRAVFDQSWNLLAPAEQTALARLSLLRGTFDLEAAEAVGGASLSVLASLADKSLLHADGRGGYALHDLLRHFAAEHLAQEADAAGHHQRVINYLTMVAERTSHAHDHRQAAGYLSQAIAIAQEAGRADLLGELHHTRGQALLQVRLWVEARPDLVAALAAADAMAVDQQVKLLLELAEVDFFLHDVPRSRQHVNEALARAEAVQRGDLVAEATIYLGFGEANEGNLNEAVRLYEQALALGGDAHMNLGRTLYWLGRYPEAVMHLRLGVESVHGNPTGQIFPLLDLGLALAATGEYTEAVRVFGQARHLSREHEVWPLLARSVANLAGFHLDVFDYAGNEALAEEARVLARAADFVLAEVSAGLDLLFNYARRKEIGRAEKLLPDVTEAVEKAHGSHGWLWRLRLAQARAELVLARGDFDEALRLAETALQSGRNFSRIKYQVLALRTRAQALAALGGTAAALVDLRLALDITRPTTDPSMFFQVASALLALEEDDALAQEAYATARRIRAALPSDEMRHAFDAAEPVRHVARLIG